MRAVLRATLAARRAAYRSGKLFAGLKFGFSFHCDLPNNFGVYRTEAGSSRSKRSTASLRSSRFTDL
jgi:hypothetical protein